MRIQDRSPMRGLCSDPTKTSEARPPHQMHVVRADERFRMCSVDRGRSRTGLSMAWPPAGLPKGLHQKGPWLHRLGPARQSSMVMLRLDMTLVRCRDVHATQMRFWHHGVAAFGNGAVLCVAGELITDLVAFTFFSHQLVSAPSVLASLRRLQQCSRAPTSLGASSRAGSSALASGLGASVLSYCDCCATVDCLTSSVLFQSLLQSRSFEQRCLRREQG